MPYFRYEIEVARKPLHGEVAVLSDGIIIQGGTDVEYPDYGTSGSFVTIAKVKFYKPDNTPIGGTRSLGNISCAADQQNEYYPKE